MMEENSRENNLVLIVDDSINNLKMLNKTLSQHGYDVIESNKGADVLRLVNENKPDIILLDIMMPGFNGYQIAKSLKSDSVLKDIPIIFVTAKSETDDIVKGFEIGASDYITKPFNIEEVAARVNIQIKYKELNQKNLRTIEELEKSNADLEKAKNDLKIADRRREQFFSLIAQELRNPFQGMLGLSELLVSSFGKFSVEELLDISYNLNTSAKQLYNMLDNLLNWSMLRLGNVEYQPTKENLNHAINDVLDNLRDQIKVKDIQLIKEVPENIVSKVDLYMFHSIATNILFNSIKYSNLGSSIILKIEKKDGQIIMKITDQGVGMDEERVGQLFSDEIITSAIGTGDEPGTGIGLQIVKEFIDYNKGSIAVESAVNEGTQVTVKLPFKI